MGKLILREIIIFIICLLLAFIVERATVSKICGNHIIFILRFGLLFYGPIVMIRTAIWAFRSLKNTA